VVPTRSVFCGDHHPRNGLSLLPVLSNRHSDLALESIHGCVDRICSWSHGVYVNEEARSGAPGLAREASADAPLRGREAKTVQDTGSGK
jgi:hypothetical protein